MMMPSDRSPIKIESHEGARVLSLNEIFGDIIMCIRADARNHYQTVYMEISYKNIRTLIKTYFETKSKYTTLDLLQGPLRYMYCASPRLSSSVVFICQATEATTKTALDCTI